MSTMPVQKSGKSEQAVETPDEFIKVVKKRLAITEFAIDLAADKNNTKAELFYSIEHDSLTMPWVFDGWNWLNPEYADISPWVEKCWIESRKGAKIACLIPASVGSNYWAKWIDGKAYVTFLNGRIKFIGHKAGFPKDLVLLLYTSYLAGGSTIWRWHDDIS